MRKIVIGICFIILLSLFIPRGDSHGPLTLKWEVRPTYWGHFHPSMGDVNNDGAQEIAVKYGDTILILNGKTGETVWSSSVDSEGSSTILELTDLNKDEIPEIVYCGSDLRVYARDGFGKLLWESDRVSGENWSGTSIVTGDTNHDGYPEIYVVTQDENGRYMACITKLDHSGRILSHSETCFYPCWGGLALADVNFDGSFEVYLGDRGSSEGPGGRSNPYPSNPARGLSCYDADNLKTLWTRPDLHQSTPARVDRRHRGQQTGGGRQQYTEQRRSSTRCIDREGHL